MARRGETRDVDRAFAPRRLEAAQSFLHQAHRTAEGARGPADRSAAVSSAILAAIAASDAACTVRLGQVWKGDHARAHTLLATVSGAEEAARALHRLTALKTNVQYLSETVTDTKLTSALRQADRVVEFADRVLNDL